MFKQKSSRSSSFNENQAFADFIAAHSGIRININTLMLFVFKLESLPKKTEPNLPLLVNNIARYLNDCKVNAIAILMWIETWKEFSGFDKARFKKVLNQFKQEPFFQSAFLSIFSHSMRSLTVEWLEQVFSIRLKKACSVCNEKFTDVDDHLWMKKIQSDFIDYLVDTCFSYQAINGSIYSLSDYVKAEKKQWIEDEGDELEVSANEFSFSYVALKRNALSEENFLHKFDKAICEIDLPITFPEVLFFQTPSEVTASFEIKINQVREKLFEAVNSRIKIDIFPSSFVLKLINVECSIKQLVFNDPVENARVEMIKILLEDAVLFLSENLSIDERMKALFLSYLRSFDLTQGEQNRLDAVIRSFFGTSLSGQFDQRTFVTSSAAVVPSEEPVSVLPSSIQFLDDYINSGHRQLNFENSIVALIKIYSNRQQELIQALYMLQPKPSARLGSASENSAKRARFTEIINCYKKEEIFGNLFSSNFKTSIKEMSADEIESWTAQLDNIINSYSGRDPKEFKAKTQSLKAEFICYLKAALLVFQADPDASNLPLGIALLGDFVELMKQRWITENGADKEKVKALNDGVHFKEMLERFSQNTMPFLCVKTECYSCNSSSLLFSASGAEMNSLAPPAEASL